MNNTTRSELSFVPSTEDDGKSITCRAENPNVTGLFLETAWKLDIVCKYILLLKLHLNETQFSIYLFYFPLCIFLNLLGTNKIHCSIIQFRIFSVFK